MLGVIGRAGGPSSVLDLEPDLFIALLEGIVREDPALSEVLDDLYAQAAAAAAPPVPESREERRNEIRRAMRLFHG